MGRFLMSHQILAGMVELFYLQHFKSNLSELQVRQQETIVASSAIG
jgi:hypothetical protein